MREEPIFEFHDVEGTIVGFFTPDYLRGVNVPGYHLHFITADRRPAATCSIAAPGT